jgi:hypothetical protein
MGRNRSRQSAGKIFSQANNVYCLLHKNTKNQLKNVVNADTSRKYFINEQIMQTLRKSIDEEKKSNRIF